MVIAQAPDYGVIPETPGFKFQDFVECHQRKAQLEKELAQVKARMIQLEGQALHELEEMGTTSIRTKSGHTVYLAKEVYASLVEDKEQAHEALRRHGLDYMVKDNVNGNTLSSWVRERDREENAIPPELAEVLRITRRLRVKVKKS